MNEGVPAKDVIEHTEYTTDELLYELALEHIEGEPHETSDKEDTKF